MELGFTPFPLQKVKYSSLLLVMEKISLNANANSH